MRVLPVTIKNLLVLLLYFTEPIASTRSVFENLRPHPWFFTQRMHPKRFVAVPRQVSRPNLPKIMYWKHLLELECIKELCQYHQDSLARKNPLEIIRQKQINAFRNDQNHHRGPQNHLKIKENQFKPGLQDRWKHFGTENIIFWPTEKIITGKKSNVSTAKHEFRQPELFKPFAGGLSGSLKPRINSKDSVVIRDNIQQKLQTRYGGSPKEVQNVKATDEKESGRWADPNDLPLSNLFRNSGITKSSTATQLGDTPQNVRQHVNSDRVMPYEVEEFFEENVQVDVNEDKDESIKIIGGKKIVEENAWEKEMIRKQTKGKNDEQNVIDNSVNTILKRLMVNPVTKAVSPSDSDISGGNPPLIKAEKGPPWIDVNSNSFVRTFTSHPKEKTSWNHPETYSGPKNVPTPKPKFHNWYHKSAKVTQSQKFKPDNTRIDSSRRLDFTSNSKQESFKSFLTTESPEMAEAIESPQHDFRHPQSELTDGSERFIHLPKSDRMNTLEVMRNLHADQQPTNPTAQSVNDGLLYPTTASFISDDILPEESTAGSSYEDSKIMFTEVESISTTGDSLTTVEIMTKSDVSTEEKTESDFVEFTDHPESFDLLNTTINSPPKKDQETTWKNSRKMNLEQETEADEAEQRRSDILISDNLADYADDDNGLSNIGYIEKLKQNSSLENLTAEDLLPLIPVIINDLREAKIPNEDYPILSRALGKYWKPVLALSNFTNMDMLPFLKMKSEEDLNNILQSFLPQNLTTPETATDDKVDDYYSPSYDYMEEYKELYKDILGQELGDVKRRFRPRRDTEDDLKTLEATREYFESIAEESNEGESDYFFEDIMYDEVSDSEDSSVFELMEVAGVQINKDT